MWVDSLELSACNFVHVSSPSISAFVALIVSFINLSSLLSMSCYVRNGARLKRHINVVAYFLMLFALFNLFRVVFNEVWVSFPITYTEVALQAIVFGVILYNRGNVSFIFPYKRRKHEA